MKGRKFSSIGLTVLITTFLWIAPVWASEQDTGYPWFADIEDNQTIQKPAVVLRVHPRIVGEDTGYPWFADTKEYNQTIKKPVTVFGGHPQTVEQDTGYPWFADTKEDKKSGSKPSTTTQ